MAEERRGERREESGEKGDDLLSLTSAQGLTEMQSTKTLYERRESLHSRVASSEVSLSSLRSQLEESADALLMTRQQMTDEEKRGERKGEERETSLEIRKRVLDLSKKLEEEEREYVTLSSELAEVEVSPPLPPSLSPSLSCLFLSLLKQ